MKPVLYSMLGNKLDSSVRLSGFSKIKRSVIQAESQIGRHTRIVKSKLGRSNKIGKYCKINNSVTGDFTSLGSYVWLNNVEVGIHSYLSKDVNLTNLEMGSFCSIGPKVINHLGNHPTRTFVSTHPAFYTPESPTGSFVDEELFPSYGGKVVVGNDVWIGTEVILMDGITVGDGAVVAARSVVTKDVPPYSVVGGTPAKIIRYRFDAEEIEQLLKIAWWERDLVWIKENAHLFNNVENFLSHIDT